MINRRVDKHLDAICVMSNSENSYLLYPIDKLDQ